MQISSIHSVLGWFFGDKLKVEERHTYHYDKGNSVTVVERRLIDLHLYDHRAVIPATEAKGTKVDLVV